MARESRQRRHILLERKGRAESFTSPRSGGGAVRTPRVDRASHAEGLRDQLRRVERALDIRAADRARRGEEPARGFYLSFASAPGFELKLDSLEAEKKGIELVAVRPDGDAMLATVFVPDGLLGFFVAKVEQYASEDARTGRPKNRSLVESISSVRLAAIQSFWTESTDEMPPATEVGWWEVWLRARDEATADRFERHARDAGLRVGEDRLSFPDRVVLLVRGTLRQLAASVEVLDILAELRRPDGIGSFFTYESAAEQGRWARELAGRLVPPAPQAAAVCLLDTGVARHHPLIEPALDPADLHTCEPAWGTHDHNGHGTGMAGVALYGDLRSVLAARHPVALQHRLESAKILPPGDDQNDPKLYGRRTADGLRRAELAAPERERVVALAVTTTDSRRRGMPSSWSGEVDRLACGADEEDEVRRLFFVAAGNVRDNPGLDYPERNVTDEIHDPAQAWNAITVGAYTSRTAIDEPSYAGWSPIAPAGGLSPTSSTSCTWPSAYPIKPEIVVEGGNMALSPERTEADFPDSLSVLTTRHELAAGAFAATGDTSAATAAAARLAAIVRTHYPDLWPETVRALLIDSAEWTPHMRAELDAPGNLVAALRTYGYGVPVLERALWSVSNTLTLVIEDELVPFAKRGSNEMHLHALPWPQQALQALGDARVELRVTLSYFVEPNPARRGDARRHKYASHGLQFDLQRSRESLATFRKRINKAARDPLEAIQSEAPGADRWFLGGNLRSRGSLKHDRWEGPAKALAKRGHLAVFPTVGWWRERPSLGRSASAARYALVVTIRTAATDVDIYQAVVAMVRPKIAVGT